MDKVELRDNYCSNLADFEDEFQKAWQRLDDSYDKIRLDKGLSLFGRLRYTITTHVEEKLRKIGTDDSPNSILHNHILAELLCTSFSPIVQNLANIRLTERLIPLPGRYAREPVNAVLGLLAGKKSARSLCVVHQPVAIAEPHNLELQLELFSDDCVCIFVFEGQANYSDNQLKLFSELASRIKVFFTSFATIRRSLPDVKPISFTILNDGNEQVVIIEHTPEQYVPYSLDNPYHISLESSEALISTNENDISGFDACFTKIQQTAELCPADASLETISRLINKAIHGVVIPEPETVDIEEEHSVILTLLVGAVDAARIPDRTCHYTWRSVAPTSHCYWPRTTRLPSA